MKTDVLIIGSGLSGLTLAALLGRAGVGVAVIDREPPLAQLAAGYDARTTALSFASHEILRAAGAWDAIEKIAEPMRQIRVADGGSPLFLHFSDVTDGNGRPFGWNLENARLRKILYANVKKIKSVRHLAPVEIKEFFRENETAGVILKDGAKISAPLMIGADGRNSAVRKWLGIGVKTADYEQTAIVCNIAHELGHENVAVEHFLPEGPFAVLPLTKDGQKHRSSVVWTVPHAAAKKILALAPEKFDAALQKLCGAQLGKIASLSAPRGYPLHLLHAESYTAPRVALMAEAAHAIHPIAGQGLNLSMRDAALLAEMIVDSLKLGLDIGAPSLLKKYENIRRADTRLMAGFTDILNRMFSNNLRSVALLRDLGLGIIQKSPPIKGFFARQAMGLGGKQARIVRRGRL